MNKALLTFLLLLTPGLAAAEPSERAMALAQSMLIIDGHIDGPSTIANDGADIAAGDKVIDFDYARAKAGGLDAPFMSIYVAAAFEEKGGSRARADILIGLMEGVAAQNPDKFEIAYSPKDVRRIAGEGKIALPLGMENGAPIEGDLDTLKHFYDRGIRYITLAHSKANHISDSSYDENEKWGGLSPFGFEVVRAMNNLGVMVDVSHITDAAIEDVLSVVRAPVIASHSSLRHFTPGFHRNLPDDLVVKIGENGGVIMINYGSPFLTAEANTYSIPRDAARVAQEAKDGRAMTDEERDAFNDAWRESHPYPYAGLDDVLNHIDRVVELAGVDTVGIGSDYDGVGDSLPVGLKDVSSYPVLIQGLIDRGYDEAAIEKILGSNAMRVWEAVEDARKRRWR
ncbi:MAG: membrane dipeptidase [Alphaproteobacteria bacterium]|nr:membrane dipeptidase [Alphaproteobacteria bacterium]